MSDNDSQETTESVDTTEGTEQVEAQEPDTEVTDDQEPDTFPRAYVEDLRRENADYRTRAKAADDLARRLHTELVRATGRLADPTDMPFDAEHLDGPERLASALDALLEAKPHLKARKVTGSIGQGESGGSGSFSLLDAMRSGA